MTPPLSGIYRTVIYAVIFSWQAVSCVTTDFDECPNVYQATFSYDMNPYGVDAFPSQVSSVNLYAFDAESGRLKYSSSEHSGALLGQEHYRMPLQLPPGIYDLVVWGGMYGNDHFEPLPYSPASIDDVCVSVAHEGECSRLLRPVYHGQCRVELANNNFTGFHDVQTVKVSLVKNTNRINVSLIRQDSELPMSAGDFNVSILSENSRMAHDNSVGGRILYRPWSVRVFDSKVHMSELSTTRLMADAHSRLDVVRASDYRCIVSIPLEDNLLQYRKEFHSSMDEQEYLDRLDEFDITFVLAENDEWNASTEIYINKWAVMPIQYVDW